MSPIDSCHASFSTAQLEPRDVEAIKAGYFREAKTNLVATFAIVTFLAGGGAVIGIKLFGSFRFDSVVAFGIGSLFGLAAAVCLLMKGFPDYLSVRADLSSNVCEVLHVQCRRAVDVRLNDRYPTVALDCGDVTLLITGRWWLNRSRKELWRSQKERSAFPATQFELRRLPRSGRVVSVSVGGDKLPIATSDPIEPLVESEIPFPMETHYVNTTLDSLIASSSQCDAAVSPNDEA